MDVLDVAYAVLVERHDRLVDAMVARGGDPQRMGEARDALDEALAEEIGQDRSIDPEQLELRRALGVA